MSGSCEGPPPPAPAAEPAREPLWSVVLTAGCRYALAAVFLMAALTKIADLSGFRDRVVLRTGLPPRLAEAVGASLPWLELTCALCLVLGTMRREASALLAILLLLFIGHALLSPAGDECGCFLFPATAPASRWLPLGRNLLLLGCALRTCGASLSWPRRARAFRRSA